MKRIRTSLIIVLVILVLAACTPAEPEPKTYPENTLAAFLQADGRFNTFLEIADEIVLEHEPPLLERNDLAVTLFVPTDEAFAQLPEDLLNRLKTEEPLAEILLFHHGFDKPRFSADFGLLNTWPTINTLQHISFEFEGDQTWYDGVLVIESDIEVGDHVIHVLDGVAGLELLPEN